MSWSGEEIKSLRLRLGWSRAELGRRLGLGLEQSFELEAGTLKADLEVFEALDTLEAQLSDYSRSLKLTGICNKHMKEASKTQARVEDLEEFAKGSELK